MPIFNGYPYTDFHEINLDFVLDQTIQMKELGERLDQTVTDLVSQVEDFENAVTDQVDGLSQDFTNLSTFVDNYFDNLDVQTEINVKLDQMAQDGDLGDIILATDAIPTAVSDWLEDNITPTTPAIDATLTIQGAAADAKAAGDKITINTKKADEDLTAFAIAEGHIRYWAEYQFMPIGSSAATALSVERIGEVSIINGTTGSSIYRCLMSGEAYRGTLGNIMSQPKVIHLQEGHKYLFHAHEISGTCTSVVNIEVRESSTVKIIDNLYPYYHTSRIYDAPADKDISLVIYVASGGNTADNYKFACYVQDITEMLESSNAISYVNDRVDDIETQLNTSIRGEMKRLSASDNKISAVPAYNIPERVKSINNYIVMSQYGEGVNHTLTQGICSDGQRYIFFPLTTGGEFVDGFAVNTIKPIIVKWDTWTNTQAANTDVPTVNYGHVEDMAFIPADFAGFDNGNVDRIYIIDGNHSPIYDAQGNIQRDGNGDPLHTTDKLIHVLAASDLSYITSFPTLNLSNASAITAWNGINHITTCPERGYIICDSPYYYESDVIHRTLAIFNAAGQLVKAVDMLYRQGTMGGWDCDENYIYMTRYVTSGKYIHVWDYDLNPVETSYIENYIWEYEGMTHIGNNLYLTWNDAIEDRTGAVIANAIVSRKTIVPIGTQFPINWTSASAIPPANIAVIYP